MSTPTLSTKTDILHEASRMLLARGFHGFSLQELADSLQLKKSSLFHHYPSKLALAVELYRFYQASFTKWTEAHRELAAEKQIIAYTQELTSWICEKQRVCPVGALSLEWHLVEPELQVEIKKLHELQKAWLTKQMKGMRLRLPLKEALMGTMALIQGSIQLGRLNDDPTLVIKNLKAHLKILKADP
jgi:TetR/AcrR family transcriptional regulator, transcriptional repressor for nem operon